MTRQTDKRAHTGERFYWTGSLVDRYLAGEGKQPMMWKKKGTVHPHDKVNQPGNQRTSPRSSTSLVLGSVMLRNRAVRGGGRPRVRPAIHFRAVAEAGPLARITATPHLPWPEDKAKMVSASARPTGGPSKVARNLQGGVPLLEINDKAHCNQVHNNLICCYICKLYIVLRRDYVKLYILEGNQSLPLSKIGK